MDEEAFLAAIQAMPDDHRTRLVYADWLDENGRPEAAEYLRLRHEQLVIAARLDELTRTLDRDWYLKLGHKFDLVVRAYPIERKIGLIKLVRELTGKGLGESKAFVEQPLPFRLLGDVPLERALEVQALFSPYANVTLEPHLPPAGG